MTTHPRAEELVDAVTQWIDQVRPTLDPRNAFLARVSVNALGMVARELRAGEPACAAATARLQALLGETGSFQDLTQRICMKLRTQELGAETPGLLATLRANVLDQLAIDQPGYRHEGGANAGD